jgi:hypothetical protein
MSTSVPSQVLTQSPKRCCNGDHKDDNRDWKIAARSISCVLAKKVAEVATLFQISSMEKQQPPVHIQLGLK